MVEIEVKIKTDKIQLDQFLKWANLVSSGGEAKALIQGEKVLVNGKIEQRRARKIMKGDRVELEGQNPVYKVNSE
ncbi:MAG: RNA-binding S4 domain-containing protein [Halanaerobiales bacterium]|nr:RNA-binding S4 domain-containing protein [Halanaerobiales bacterium]